MSSGAVRDDQAVADASKGFKGGLNLRDGINDLQEDECKVLENMILNERGAASKRLGCESHGTFNTSADRILSMYVFYRPNLAPHVLIHTTAGVLYYTADPTATTVTWTAIVSGVSTSAPYSYDTFNGKCYFSNGVDAYASWDGTTYTTYPSAPKGKFICIWKDTMWNSLGDDRVYSSVAGDAETWPATAWVDIGKGDGDRIRGLATDGTYLIIFKRRRHMIIYNPSDFSNRIVDPDKGAESHFAVCTFDGRLFFLSRGGICEFYGDSPSKIISPKLDPLFDPNILNFNALSTAWAYQYQGRVSFLLPEVGRSYPTMQVDLYPRIISQETGSVSRLYSYANPLGIARMPVSCGVLWRYMGNEFAFGGHNTANKFLKLYASVGTDDGVAFSGTLQTKAYDFQVSTRTKYIRRIWILGRGKFNVQLLPDYQDSQTITIPVDMGAATDLWDSVHDRWDISGTWSSPSAYVEQAINPDRYVRHVSLKLTDGETTIGALPIYAGAIPISVDSGEWAIYGIIFDGVLLGVRV